MEPSLGDPVIGRPRAACLHRRSSATRTGDGLPPGRSAFSKRRFISIRCSIGLAAVKIEVFYTRASIENHYALAGSDFTRGAQRLESCETGCAFGTHEQTFC